MESKRELMAEMSVDALLDAAVRCVDQLALDEALRHYQRILQLEPNNVAALDGLGEMSMQLGDVNSARQAFEQSVKLSPAGNAGRYMYLGQMHQGRDALRWFECGVHWLRKERNAVEHASGSRKELQEQWVASSHALATALCSVAEMYLTDSCDEADAEQKCEMLATEAVGLVQGLAEQAHSSGPFTHGREEGKGERSDDVSVCCCACHRRWPIPIRRSPHCASAKNGRKKQLLCSTRLSRSSKLLSTRRHSRHSISECQRPSY